MTPIEKISKFVKDNNLQFTEGRRNSDCTILAGFVLSFKPDYEADEILDIVAEIEDFDPASLVSTPLIHDSILTDELNTEFNRVWEYAKANGYGNWWSTPDAKKQYIF